MIDEKEIRETIALCLGNPNPQSKDAILLAACYIIQAYQSKSGIFGNLEQLPGYSFAPPPTETPQTTAAPETIGEYGSSEFLQAVAGKDPATYWGVIDELMDDLSVINPRVYASVMRKIR